MAGRRPGPSDTRALILGAATARFTSRGYEATSMRQIAADADVDPALVRYFFGTKEKLFAETAAAVIRPDRAVSILAAGPRAELGERLVRYFLGLLGDVDAPGPLLGLIRSAVTLERAAALLREFLTGQVLGPIAELAGEDEAELRAALAASQLVGLAITRYALGLPALTAAETEHLVAWVAPTLQRYYTGGAP
ncbi:TetR/AcrR family transcriptional regulator [Actinomadura geliboluensis]|uniref:TetR/AcrR family transcriptional regulator n=1 Tax=Actinomadura geliboluensis TaxID=882440 RepID=UPI00370F892F